MNKLRKQYEQEVAMSQDSQSHKDFMLTDDNCYLEWLAEQGKMVHYTKDVGNRLQAYGSYDGGDHFHFLWENSRHNIVIENLVSWYEEAANDNA